MRGLLAFVLIPALLLGTPAWASAQADDGAAELDAVRALILKSDYQGAQLSTTLYCKKIAEILRQSSSPGGVPKNLMQTPGAAGRERLLLMVDQVKQMHSSGDLWSTLKYADTLREALREEYRRSLPTPAQRLEKVERLVQGSTGTRRMQALSMAAKAAMEAGDTEKARNYSSQVLRTADPSSKDWRQADALYLGHIIAGRVALRSRDLDGAKRHLTESTSVISASPSAAALGPDIPFAAELIEAGERDLVLSYLAECAKWWKADAGQIAQWSEMIRQGKQPWAEWIQLRSPAR